MKNLLKKEWYECKKCGLEIGLLGRFIEKIFPFKPFIHTCHDINIAIYCDILRKYDNFEFYLKIVFNKILTLSSITHASDKFNFFPKHLFFMFIINKSGYYFADDVNNTANTLKIGLERRSFKQIYNHSYRTEAYCYKSFINILDDLNETMDKLGIPDHGRYIVIPAVIGSVIKKTDIDTSVCGSCENGLVGLMKGFKIMLNGNIYRDGTRYKCIAGHESAIMMNHENISVNKKDSHLLRGYVEYNFEIVNPEWLFTIPVMVG